MLSEQDCSILFSAVDVFLQDFDPRDAIIYLESKGVLTEDLSEQIESKMTRLERIRELLRVYKRRADDLTPLIGYFEFSCQMHIVDFLKKLSENNIHDNGLNANDILKTKLTKEKRLRRLLSGQVPSVRNIVKRESDIQKLSQTLKKRANQDSFFIVLYGMAGVGKTTLAASTLTEDDEIIGRYYNSVCYLRDSRKKPDQDEPTLHIPSAKDLSTVSLTKQIRDALFDKPNAIIFLDDVTMVDTVRWADQLGLRVIATTRDAHLFDAATSPVEVIHVNGFSLNEAVEQLELHIPALEVDASEKKKLFEDIYKLVSGNPAIIGKLLKSSSGKYQRLVDSFDRLRKKGVSSVSCITSYESDDIHVAISSSVTKLDDVDRNTLACAVVMPSDVWIPIEVWNLVVPVDVGGRSDGQTELYEQLSRLGKKGDFIRESENGGSFLIPSVISVYLKESVDDDTVKILSAKLSLAYDSLKEMDSDSVSTVITDFFTKNSVWLAFAKELYA